MLAGRLLAKPVDSAGIDAWFEGQTYTDFCVNGMSANTYLEINTTKEMQMRGSNSGILEAYRVFLTGLEMNEVQIKITEVSYTINNTGSGFGKSNGRSISSGGFWVDLDQYTGTVVEVIADAGLSSNNTAQSTLVIDLAFRKKSDSSDLGTYRTTLVADHVNT